MKLQGSTGSCQNTHCYHYTYQTLFVIHNVCASSASTYRVKDKRHVTGVSSFGVSSLSIPLSNHSAEIFYLSAIFCPAQQKSCFCPSNYLPDNYVVTILRKHALHCPSKSRRCCIVRTKLTSARDIGSHHHGAAVFAPVLICSTAIIFGGWPTLFDLSHFLREDCAWTFSTVCIFLADLLSCFVC